MTDAPHDLALTGKLLVAMPGMGDTRFEHSVVFLCNHSDEGAMGLIVNKPTEALGFRQLLERLDIPAGPGMREIKVHFGGPVEHGRGFVLHSGGRTGAGTLEVDERFGMTATLDVLEELASGAGPDSAILALGYAGWGPGQLEDEILQNGWLTCDADPALVFGADDGAKWSAALRSMGIEPSTLSAYSGRA